MSEKTGTTISCDRYDCEDTAFGRTTEEARETASRREWTKEEDGRDFCYTCTKIRAGRKKPAEVVPEGVRLFLVLDAAREAGFDMHEFDQSDDDEGHYPWCCGQKAEVHSLIGSPYGVRCEKCGKAIADLFGPSFGNSWVQTCDSDKVDTEDPVCWVIVSEFNEVQAATQEPS